VTQDLKRWLSAISIPLTVVFALMAPATAQRNSNLESVPYSAAPYRVGEHLTYNVSFSNFISAAHVELLVAAHGTFYGREGIQLNAHVETTGVINAALYALNNDYTTYVDPSTGLPFRAQQVVREASRTADSSNEFNQPAGTAAIPSKQQTEEFPGTYDLLSALYRLRSLPLREGGSYYFRVRGESQEYAAELQVTGHEMIKTNVGSYDALVTQIRVSNDSHANNYHLRIYFSDDERHVPVLIKARLSAGELRAELAGSEFLAPAPPKPTPAPPDVASATPAAPNIASITPSAPNTASVTPQSSQPIPEKPADSDDGSSADLPFKIGEQLNYQVFVGNTPQPLGTATFQVRARSRYFDHEGLLFSVIAQTTGAAQRLVFANYQINSYVDPKTLLPFRVELNLAEGHRRSNDILTVNQDYGAAVSDKGERIEIPVGTHDYVSLLYALRTFNLQPPKRNAVSILVNNRPKTLFVTSLGRDIIDLGPQKIPAIQVSLTTDDPQSDKFQLRAWLSDDERRLPLRFTATTELGPLRSDLVIIPVTRQ
jgi:uncharacterized protein DUF3108